MTGGVYNILANSYMNSSATMTAASQVTANLGFSVSSLERILLVQRQDATFVNADTKFTIGNRAPNGLSEYQYLINSESYPSRPIIVDYRAGNTLNNNPVKSGALVSLCNQSGSQGLFPNAYSSESPAGTSVGVLGADNAGTTGGNIGTALFGCEFETGLSDGKSSTIYSGVSTLASNVQFLGKYANAGTTGATLDFFGMFSVLISLDMKGSGVFSVSV